MSVHCEQNKLCETCLHTARTYLTNYTPACENYEEDKGDEHAN